jgi:hypothetical protein
MWEVSLQQSAPARLQLSPSRNLYFSLWEVSLLLSFPKKEEKIHAHTNYERIKS